MSVFLSDLIASNARSKMQEFTTSGVFTIPTAAKTLKITLVGGGGSGGYNSTFCSAGGSGYIKTRVMNFPVDSMLPLTITIGVGAPVNGVSGASTVVQNAIAILTAAGGMNGGVGSGSNGGIGQVNGQGVTGGGISSPPTVKPLGGRNPIGYGHGGDGYLNSGGNGSGDVGTNGYCLIEWTE